jgi:hypothetical protein
MDDFMSSDVYSNSYEIEMSCDPQVQNMNSCWFDFPLDGASQANNVWIIREENNLSCLGSQVDQGPYKKYPGMHQGVMEFCKKCVCLGEFTIYWGAHMLVHKNCKCGVGFEMTTAGHMSN